MIYGYVELLVWLKVHGKAKLADELQAHFEKGDGVEQSSRKTSNFHTSANNLSEFISDFSNWDFLPPYGRGYDIWSKIHNKVYDEERDVTFEILAQYLEERINPELAKWIRTEVSTGSPRIRGKRYRTLYDILGEGFPWRDTPQGMHVWSEISDNAYRFTQTKEGQLWLTSHGVLNQARLTEQSLPKKEGEQVISLST